MATILVFESTIHECNYKLVLFKQNKLLYHKTTLTFISTKAARKVFRLNGYSHILCS